jgi:hypothetical protein
MTSKIKLLGLAAAAALLQASAAHATLLNWSYTASDGTFGSGTFTADQDPTDSTKYHLTSATGTINGHTVTALDSFDGADDLAFPTSPIVEDSNGIGFAISATESYNIYEDDGLFTPGDTYSCLAVYCIEGPGTDADAGLAVGKTALTSFDVSLAAPGVPEPATWAMMLLGFGGLGATLRMRRRTAAAAA